MTTTTSQEARQRIRELANKYGLCSHYTCSGAKLFGLNADFCHAQTMDDTEDLTTLMAWLQKIGVER